MKQSIHCKDIAIYNVPEEREYPAGIKWTRQRKAVYDVLSETEEPLNATKIYRLVEERADGEEYAPSTIYRILATFEEKCIISKEADMGDGTILYSLNRGEHKHYAVCLECHKRIPLQNCPFSHIHMDKNTDDFMMVDHKLEIYGYCSNCKEGKMTE